MGATTSGNYLSQPYNLYFLLALEVIFLQGIMQTGKHTTMPRPKILPLLRRHGNRQHVQPAADYQVGVICMFPLEVRARLIHHKVFRQCDQSPVERCPELLPCLTPNPNILPGAQVRALAKGGPDGVGRAGVEGEVLADEVGSPSIGSVKKSEPSSSVRTAGQPSPLRTEAMSRMSTHAVFKGTPLKPSARRDLEGLGA